VAIQLTADPSLALAAARSRPCGTAAATNADRFQA
jgi:hypothetical protein